MRRKKIIIALLVAVGATAILCGITIGVQYFGRSGLEANIGKAIEKKIQSEEIPGEALPYSIQYSNAVLGAIQYQIISCDQRNKTATVSFNYVDAIALADQYGEIVCDADEFYIFCVNSITNKTAPFETKEIEIQYYVVEENGQAFYVIENSPELADVLTGGTFSEYLQLIGGVS